MSAQDLPKGKPWFVELQSQLNEILFGVFCVTPENGKSQWMQWEAGFLSSSSALGDRRVVPLGIGMSAGAIDGPLSVYQGADSTREGMLQLIKNINSALPDASKISEQTLEMTFEHVWPSLERDIEAAAAISLAPEEEKATTVSTDDKLDEVIALLRDQQRELADTKQRIDRIPVPLRNLEGLGAAQTFVRPGVAGMYYDSMPNGPLTLQLPPQPPQPITTPNLAATSQSRPSE